MSETKKEIQLPLPGFAEPQKSAASTRFNEELGAQVESLAYMLRKPTDERPFIYECRFDLIPAKQRDPMLVLKGFGENGSLVAFHNAPSFLQLLRGVQAQMVSGKLQWYPDQYQTDAYSLRVERYLAGEFYKVT